MKKIITLTAVTLTAISVNAQGDDRSMQNMQMSPEALRIFASILVLVLFMAFILTILKRMLDHRLKNKIIDKGISENIASSILQTNTGDGRHVNIKWFAILAGIGAGLTIIYYTQPLGIHSLAIMSFSIALSFLVYYFYLKQAGK